MGLWDIFGGSQWLSGAGAMAEKMGKTAGWSERGVSETLQGKPAPMSSTYQAPFNTPPVFRIEPQSGIGYPGPVLGAKTGGTPPTGVGQGDQGYYMSQPGAPAYDEVAGAYGPVMEAINRLESEYQKQLPLMEEQVRGEGAALRPGVEQRKTELLGGLTAGRATAETQAKGDIAKTRQLYQDLQRQRISELSAQGISSSSYAEGSMELLGRGIGQQIGGARTSLTNTLSQIATEERNIQSWATNKMTEIDQQTQNALTQVRLKFNDVIAQIGQLRVGTEQAKADRRLEALYSYRSEVAKVQEFNANMKMALEQWTTQKANILADTKSKIANVAQYNYQPDYAGLKQQFPGLQASQATWQPRGGYWDVGYAAPEEEENPWQ